MKNALIVVRGAVQAHVDVRKNGDRIKDEVLRRTALCSVDINDLSYIQISGLCPQLQRVNKT